MKNLIKWMIPLIYGIIISSCDSNTMYLDLNSCVISTNNIDIKIQSININHKDELIKYSLKPGVSGISDFNLCSPDSSKYKIQPNIVYFIKNEYYLILVSIIKNKSIEEETFAFEVTESDWKTGNKIKGKKFRI